MTLPASLAQGPRLPLVAAPMLRVSGVDLVSAACCAGVIGAFPTSTRVRHRSWTRGRHASLPTPTPDEARQVFGSEGSAHVRRWVDVWSAGHTVSRVDAVRAGGRTRRAHRCRVAAVQRETAALLARPPQPHP